MYIRKNELENSLLDLDTYKRLDIAELRLESISTAAHVHNDLYDAVCYEYSKCWNDRNSANDFDNYFLDFKTL